MQELSRWVTFRAITVTAIGYRGHRKSATLKRIA